MNGQLKEIAGEIERTLLSMSEHEQENMIRKILKARRIFVAGAGRSGMIVKCFAMRLMHMGFPTYVVGEVVTPSIGREDFLIIASGSGSTASLVSMAKLAKETGADVGTITIYREAPIASLSSAVMEIHAPTCKTEKKDRVTSVQPMGNLFEQCLFISLDYLAIKIMKEKRISEEEMFSRHANLE